MKQDDVIRFTYDGGTNPGQARMVYVTECDNGKMKGYDFGRKAQRTFFISKIKGETQVRNEVIDLTSLPTSIQPAKLIKDYEADGKQAYHDDSRCAIIVCKPAPITSFINGQHQTQPFTVKISQGILTLELTVDGYSVSINWQVLTSLANLSTLKADHRRFYTTSNGGLWVYGCKRGNQYLDNNSNYWMPANNDEEHSDYINITLEEAKQTVDKRNLQLPE